MRSILTLFILALFPLFGNAQDGPGRVAQHIQELRGEGRTFLAHNLFTPLAASPETRILWDRALDHATVLTYDAGKREELQEAVGATLSLKLPYHEGDLILDLERVHITTETFRVVLSDGGETPVDQGLHYQGMIRGKPGSVAAISVFDDEVMGLLADDLGQIVLGRLEGDAQGRHVLYRDTDLKGSSGSVCSTSDEGPLYTEDQIRSDGAPRTVKCVRFYWEAGYDIFLNKGSVSNTVSYLTGLFNQTAILFSNDGIDVVLNEIFVWNTPSPYNATTSSGRLNQFGDYRTSFNGDLAHLLDYGNMGGVAWLNTLCASQTRYRMAYSGINSSYANVPTYSWSVMVVCHEQGHNMASRHTHACWWNGNNTAIDGCGQAAGYSEGSCPQGPLPPSSVGGTIMSYCHLTSSTIKFANGFGPQPTAVIVNAVNGANCLQNCGTTSCDIPGGLTASAIGHTTATLTWSNTGAGSYSIRRRLSPSGSWTTTTGLSNPTHGYTGLTASTTYDVQVRSVCGGISSNWSPTYTFTTLAPCPDALEPNNTLATAAPITLPASINALIASSSDVDYYTFTLDQTANLNLSLTNLAADFDMRLLNAAGSQLAISQNGGTSNESISYGSAPAGTYFVHVYGWNGAFSDVQCYLLTVNASGSQGCGSPQNLQASNITWNGATLSWNSMQGASGYGLQWRELGATDWNAVDGITGTSHALGGLAWSTTHECRVRAVCAGGASLYGAAIQFTTLDPPCEVLPTISLSLRVLLDGPYQGNGVMGDGLRTGGWIPQSEPYTAMGWPVSGPQTITPAVLSTAGVNAIVDWVAVELRSPTSPFNMLERRVALLQRDGDVVALDGVSPLGFCLAPGNYRVVVRHRNHLGCMTGQAYALGGSTTAIDLTLQGTSTWGTNARKNVGGTMLLWAGNALTDQLLRYTGQDNDRDEILVLIGGTVPTNTVNGYHLADITMDGVVKYTGPGNDRDPILSNVGGTVPTNTVSEQLP